ncbi:translation initiation factor IF-2 N-terminal domain-containing protein, partial [Chromobacterium haemolyticum]|uniref:translation initiation factor IF-2 N-terminal domain-containing protein n=2 Tax=Chromobacteriaceae TaxID=1499392 RepID=UPI00058499C9
MVLTNVKQFASELNLTPERLLEQLGAAGVSKRSPDDALSAQDKTQLLDYLKRSHGARDEESRIALTRKSTSEIKTADGSTVKVETRKKRFVVRPEEASAAQPAAAAESRPAEPVKAPEPAPVVEAKPEPKAEAKPEPKPEPAPKAAEAKPESKPAEAPRQEAAKPAAPKPAAPAQRPTVASILTPEEIAAREAEEKRQAAFRARQE